MLYNVSDLTGARISATDGEIGHVEEFYFDDQDWTVRYLVVDTAPLFFGRSVLISPVSIRGIAPDQRSVELDLSVEMIKNSPDVATALPVSRAHEIELAAHYEWPAYWLGQGAWGIASNPTSARLAEHWSEPRRSETRAQELVRLSAEREAEESHLRRTREVFSYEVHSREDTLGRLTDFALDDTTWQLRYLVVSMGSLFPSEHALLGVDWIRGISWRNSRVTVDLTSESIRSAPGYDPAQPIDREYETRLVRHYDKTGYWE